MGLAPRDFDHGSHNAPHGLLVGLGKGSLDSLLQVLFDVTLKALWVMEAGHYESQFIERRPVLKGNFNDMGQLVGGITGFGLTAVVNARSFRPSVLEGQGSNGESSFLGQPSFPGGQIRVYIRRPMAN